MRSLLLSLAICSYGAHFTAMVEAQKPPSAQSILFRAETTLSRQPAYATESLAHSSNVAGGKVTGVEDYQTSLTYIKRGAKIHEETTIQASGRLIKGMVTERQEVIIVNGMAARRFVEGRQRITAGGWTCFRGSTDPYIGSARPLLHVADKRLKVVGRVRRVSVSGISAWEIVRSSRVVVGKELYREVLTDDINVSTYFPLRERLVSDDMMGSKDSRGEITNRYTALHSGAHIELPSTCRGR